MKRIHYISPSLLPSRAANSVHVMLQCDAFRKIGLKVVLYAKRGSRNKDNLSKELMDTYGVDTSLIELVTFYSPWQRGNTIYIAMMAIWCSLFSKKDDIFLSRNLYAAFFISVIFRKPILFETHQLEYGFQKLIQRAVVTKPWVKTIVISKKLSSCLMEHLGVAPSSSVVLHDAARSGIHTISYSERREALNNLLGEELKSWNGVCGYFGHLYPGRGIEIIEQVALKRSDCLFLVYGGNENDLKLRKSENQLHNLRYMGHVPHPVATKIMCSVDILLMPYQSKVSIGVKRHDTARWMSPMKMFEYLASGVPLISSDLPVLREVLTDGENCLLAIPDNADSWLDAIDRLIKNIELSKFIGARAKKCYEDKYTWVKRAESIVLAAENL